MRAVDYVTDHVVCVVRSISVEVHVILTLMVADEVCLKEVGSGRNAADCVMERAACVRPGALDPC